MDAWIGREGERKEFTKKKKVRKEERKKRKRERKPPKVILFFCDIIKVTLAPYIIFGKYG